MKPLFLLLALSWLQAGLPANKTKSRPKPIEPDVTTSNNGGFHAPAPQEVKIIVEHKEIPAENTPKNIPTPEPKKGMTTQNAWRPDANGNYWVMHPSGARYYSPDKNSIQGYGIPYNP